MGSIVKGVFGGGGAAKDAGAAQAQATMAGVEEQRRQFDITQANFAPFQEAGVSALETQRALLGELGPEQAAQAITQFQESPGQKFLRERQERALLRNQAAIGGLGGGNIRTALQAQAADIASTQFGDFQNRLAGLSGTGQQATQSLGALGAQSAGSIQSGLASAGQARASGILGAQQANSALGQQVLGAGLGAAAGAGLLGSTAASALGGSAGLGALIGLFSDRRLKENIVKVGSIKDKLSWYVWDWTEEGRKLTGNEKGEGVIAQEVLELIPQAVNVDGDYLRVDYSELLSCLH